ncbi:MAG: PHP domain-containing protein [Firmicutes bacterium]|nr:PHP domain-containing protein [Bacillota bacterium]
MKIGLHNHSPFSDGRQTVEQIIEKAESEGVTDLAITDHESFGAVPYIRENNLYKRPSKIKIYPAIEIDFRHDGIANDVLIYGGNIEELSKLIPSLCPEHLQKINIEKIANLHYGYTQLGFRLPPVEQLMEIQAKSSQKPIVAFLVGLNKFKEYNDGMWAKHNAIERYQQVNFQKAFVTGKGAPYFRESKYKKPNLDELRQAATKIDGKLFLAHPNRMKPHDMKHIVNYGLANNIFDGIEVYYPNMTEQQFSDTHKLATDNGLLISGGTDSHTLSEPVGIATTDKTQAGQNIYYVDECEFNWLKDIELIC